VRFGRHIAAIASASVALLADASGALAGNGGFAPVPPESPNAEGISQSWWFVTFFVLAIFLLVEVLLVVFVVRYRRRNRPRDADGAQVHGANRLELAWTIAPVVILFAIAAFVFAKLPGIQDVPAATGDEENLVVEVTGTQFTWEFRYPNGVVAIDRLRAPEGRTVELEVTAPDWDVVHSWWIPALGGKIDAIPGKVNTVSFRAERTGLFEGQCAEFCGLQHAHMFNSIQVVPAAEFDAWLTEQAQAQETGDSDLGEQEFNGVCAKCHGPQGEGLIGPALSATSVSDARAVERIVTQGFGKMPPVGRGWSEPQVNALTAYLKQRFPAGGASGG
jgi:cytochrome c oxidase subunit 2